MSNISLTKKQNLLDGIGKFYRPKTFLGLFKATGFVVYDASKDKLRRVGFFEELFTKSEILNRDHQAAKQTLIKALGKKIFLETGYAREAEYKGKIDNDRMQFYLTEIGARIIYETLPAGESSPGKMNENLQPNDLKNKFLTALTELSDIVKEKEEPSDEEKTNKNLFWDGVSFSFDQSDQKKFEGLLEKAISNIKNNPD
jgi:hypothetical protein